MLCHDRMICDGMPIKAIWGSRPGPLGSGPMRPWAQVPWWSALANGSGSLALAHGPWPMAPGPKGPIIQVAFECDSKRFSSSSSSQGSYGLLAQFVVIASREKNPLILQARENRFCGWVAWWVGGCMGVGCGWWVWGGRGGRVM